MFTTYLQSASTWLKDWYNYTSDDLINFKPEGPNQNPYEI